MPIYGVGWTLVYEMFFYALFAGCLVLRRRAAVFVMTACLVGFVTIGASTDLPLPWHYWFNPIVLEFSFGALLGLFYAEGLRAPKWICWTLFGCGVLGWVVAYFVYHGGVPGPTQAVLPVPRPIVLGIPALLVVSGAVLIGSKQNSASVATRLMARLGDASYSIYLLHPLLVFAIMTWNLRVGNPYIGTAIDLVVLLPLSIAVFYWFEMPMQRLVKTLLSGRKHPASAKASAYASPVRTGSDAASYTEHNA